MKLAKANRRDNKIRKKKYGPAIDNKSIFLIVEEQEKRRKEILERKRRKKQRLEKEK